jgi:integrase
MASVGNDAGGRRRILFVAPDGSRKTVRLGKCDRKTAESIARRVEDLLSWRINGQVPRDTAVWVTNIGPTLHDKLAAVGLIDAATRVPTLGEFLTEYLGNREAELKPSTMKVLRQAERWMLRHLGIETRLDEITTADADKCRAELLQGRARATANKWTRYAREFLTAAVRRKLIASNPFDHIRGLAVAGNPARRVLIPAADVSRLLDVIPCPQFRLIVAMAQYAGLRVPSEALALTWDDINWEHSRIVVRTPKTAHHADGGVRVVPIFPELRPHLNAMWDAPDDGQPFVVTRYRDATKNVRTQLNRWCLQAGVKPWPKPFQNMRATRATELADQFPSHVCAKWLGHSERIADEFYRSVTDDHYKRATRGTESGTVAAQNQAQRVPAASGGKGKKAAEPLENIGVAPVAATNRETPSEEEIGRIWIRTKDLVVISDAL